MIARLPHLSGTGFRSLAALTLTALIALAPGASRAGGIIDNNTLDYSKLTCAELQTLIEDDVKKGQKQDEAGMINIIAAAMWIDGYLSHETGDTTTSQEWLLSIIQTIGDTCPKSPKRSVLAIVRASMK